MMPQTEALPRKMLLCHKKNFKLNLIKIKSTSFLVYCCVDALNTFNN